MEDATLHEFNNLVRLTKRVRLYRFGSSIQLIGALSLQLVVIGLTTKYLLRMPDLFAFAWGWELPLFGLVALVTGESLYTVRKRLINQAKELSVIEVIFDGHKRVWAFQFSDGQIAWVKSKRAYLILWHYPKQSITTVDLCSRTRRWEEKIGGGLYVVNLRQAGDYSRFRDLIDNPANAVIRQIGGPSILGLDRWLQDIIEEELARWLVGIYDRYHIINDETVNLSFLYRWSDILHQLNHLTDGLVVFSEVTVQRHRQMVCLN